MCHCVAFKRCLNGLNDRLGEQCFLAAKAHVYPYLLNLVIYMFAKSLSHFIILRNNWGWLLKLHKWLAYRCLIFYRDLAKVFQFRMVICSVPFTRSHTLHSSLWCTEYCNDGWPGWQVFTSSNWFLFSRFSIQQISTFSVLVIAKSFSTWICSCLFSKRICSCKRKTQMEI